MASRSKQSEIPSVELLEAELNKERHKTSYGRALRSTVFSLLVVAAVAVLVAVLFLPVLEISGTSMTPTLAEGDVVVSVKGRNFRPGDVVAFYYNNKILVKRAVAGSGAWVDISEDGTVYVNNVPLEEPYVSDRALGQCDIELPYQVPENRLFVMGDHRDVSVDSRSTAVGCVAEDQIVGKIVFRVWPFSDFGWVR